MSQHLFLTIMAGLVVFSVLIILWAMFKAKPDPNEKEEFDERDIYDRADDDEFWDDDTYESGKVK